MTDVSLRVPLDEMNAEQLQAARERVEGLWGKIQVMKRGGAGVIFLALSVACARSWLTRWPPLEPGGSSPTAEN